MPPFTHEMPEYIVDYERLTVRLFCDRQGHPRDGVVSPTTGRFQYPFANKTFLGGRAEIGRRAEDAADSIVLSDHARSNEDERPLDGYPVTAADIADWLNDMPSCILVPLDSRKVRDPRATALMESIEERNNPSLVLANIDEAREAWKLFLDVWYLPHAGDRVLAYLDKVQEEHEEMLEDYWKEHIAHRYAA